TASSRRVAARSAGVNSPCARGWTTMSKRWIYGLMLVAPLSLTTAACGDDADDRAALEEDELSRDLDLALQGDTLSATFEDTAQQTPDPEGPAETPAPAPVRQTPPRQQAPTPRPSPQQP